MDFLFCAVDIRNSLHVLAAVGDVTSDYRTSGEERDLFAESVSENGLSSEDPTLGVWVWVGDIVAEWTTNYESGKEFDGYAPGKGIWRKPTGKELVNFFNHGDPWLDLECDCNRFEVAENEDSNSIKIAPKHLEDCPKCHGKGYFLDRIKKE